MSQNPFAGWDMNMVAEHNRRVALSRMKGNPVSELFEAAQRQRVIDQTAITALREKLQVPAEVVVSKNGRMRCTVGGKSYSFRSTWEKNYAAYLEFLKVHTHIKDWEYEPQVFYFDGIRRGTTNYTPDFKVTFPDGKHEWREVKGHWDAKSKTKIKRFQKYFPEEPLKVIDGRWFKLNGAKLAGLVPGWTAKNKK